MLDNRESQVRWSYFSTFSTAGMQLLAAATITRFLQPKDFGLAAMAMVCYGLTGYFTQLGMGRAIVQKPGLTPGNIRAAFTLSLATGLGGFIIACALSPLLAVYYKEPRLTWVLIVFSLNLIFQSLSMVSGGLLRREFRIRDQAICDFIGYVISTFALGLPMAIKGYGVWALVVSNVSMPLIGAIAYFIARPHSVLPTFQRANYRHITAFGSKATLLTAIEAMGGSIDTLMLGRLVSPTALGLYNRSTTLSTQAVYNLSWGMSRVFHPAIARAAENAIVECRSMLQTSELQLMAIITPTCVGAAFAAQTIVPAVFGRQWAGAIPVYQALCMVAALDATFHLPGIQLEVLCQFRHKAYIQVVYVLIWALTILLTARYGITVVALAHVALEVLRTLFIHALSARSLHTSLWSLIRVLIPGIWCSAVVGLVIYGLQRLLARTHDVGLGWQLLLLVLAGFATAVLTYRVVYRSSVYDPWMRLFHQRTVVLE